MDVKEIVNDGIKREYEIVIPAGEIAELEKAKLEELQSTARIRGFRPGKVPMSLIKRRFGEAVRSSVIEERKNSDVSDLLKSKNERPATLPNVQIADLDDESSDLVLTINFDCMPEIPDVDLSSIELKKIVADLDDDVVSLAVQETKRRFPMFDDVPDGYAVQKGDNVQVNYRVAMDGEEDSRSEKRMTNVFIQTFENDEKFRLDSIIFDLIPAEEYLEFIDRYGMADHLIGMKVGDKAAIELNVPERDSLGPISGKTTKFDIEIAEIRKRRPDPPDPDDEYAKDRGFESMTAYEVAIMAQLKRHYEMMSQELLVENLVRELDKNLDFEAPEAFVDNEIAFQKRRLELSSSSNPADTFGRAFALGEFSDRANPEQKRGEEIAIPENNERLRELAKRRVKHFMYLEELAGKHEISLENNDVLDYINRVSGSELIKASTLIRCREDADYRKNVANMAFTDKTTNFVLELVAIEAKKVTPEELVKAYEDRIDIELDSVASEESSKAD